MTTRLLIEYDGTAFNGWARQKGARRTVQEELERALAIVLRVDAMPLTVAGRTDAGVHALGQVASYEGPVVNPKSVNGVLADDVAVVRCDPAPEGFSARHDATARRYRYRVLTRSQRSAFAPRTALHHPRPLDLDALQACAAALPGSHDFTAFTPSDTAHKLFVRDVYEASWKRVGDELVFEIDARTFMRNMNRVLVGTMLEVGRGVRSVEDFVALLAGAPRSAAGPTAPARGLALVSVRYPDGWPLEV